MPDKRTIERARKDRREGKSPSTQAGEFVREEIEHIRQGKHGAASTKQAIAIGLSKARRAGVELPPPKPGAASKRTREQVERDGRSRRKARSPRRARAALRALRRKGRSAASPAALSRQAKSAARRRPAAARKAAARKAARTRAARKK